MIGRLGAIGLVCLFGLVGGLAVFAPYASASDSPVNLVADEVGYDESLGVYVARGHVEMAQDDRVVMADVVTYNERSKTISASGNVAMLLPSGDTLFGNYADVSDDFKDGIVHGFRALMSDKSRLAAASAQRVGGTKMILKNAVYTPCLPCRADPSRQPIWQIKAREVVRDETAKTITYHNAWMEMWGVPIFYTPWFQHPDIGVKRQSGMLAPRYSFSSGRSGYQIETPYFMTLGDDKDVTLTPILRYGGKPGPAGAVALGEYRQRVENGAFTLEASGTYEGLTGDSGGDTDTGREFRGHVAGDGLFELNRDWRWGFTFKNTTDKEYLRQYHLGSNRWLEDQLWAEGFFGRSYFEARGYGWQTTKTEYQDKQAPIIGPLLNYDFVGEPGAGGGYWGFNAGLMNLMRRSGRDSFRISMLPSWTLPYTSSWGDVTELKLTLAADMYVPHGVDPNSDDIDPGADVNKFSGVTGRIFPQGSLKWRYPFVHAGKSFTQVIQPIAQLVVSPECCNSGKIPNEDSQTFEFDDTKVFSPDRFSGTDRVDSGSRVNYGFQWNGYGATTGKAEVFLGQSYQFLRPHNLPQESGIDQEFSDVVGRVEVAPVDWLTTRYRFRFNVPDTRMKRQEFDIQLGPPELTVSFNYTQLAGNANFNGRKQFFAGVSTKIQDYWTASVGASYDAKNTRVNGFSAGFGYNDECFGINLSGQYSPSSDTDTSSGKYTGYVTVTFKNLGDIGSSF